MPNFTIRNVSLGEVGTWHQGDTKITETDIDEMVANYEETKDRLVPWIYLGSHSSKKDMEKTDVGVPFFGSLQNLHRVGKALVADLSELPQKVYELITKGAYRRPSIELWRQWKDTVHDKMRKNVLSGICLLGADHPAVNTLPLKIGTLDDVAALYASGGDEVEKVYIEIDEPLDFEDCEIVEADEGAPKVTVIIKQRGGDNMGELETLKAQLETATNKLEASEKANSDLVDENTKAVKELEEKIELRDKADAEALVKAKDKQITEFLEEVKKVGKLLPAQEEIYADKLRNSDDLDAEIKNMTEMFKEMPQLIDIDNESVDTNDGKDDLSNELRAELAENNLRLEMAELGLIGKADEKEVKEFAEATASHKKGEVHLGMEQARDRLAKELRE